MRMLASITSTPSAFSRWRPQPPVGRRTRWWRRGASGAGQRTSRGSFFRARRMRRRQWRSWPFGAQAHCQTLDLQFPTFLKRVLIFRAVPPIDLLNAISGNDLTKTKSEDLASIQHFPEDVQTGLVKLRCSNERNCLIGKWLPRATFFCGHEVPTKSIDF